MKKFHTIVISLLQMQNIASKAKSLSPAQMDTLLRHHFINSNLVNIDVCTDVVYSGGHIQNANHRDLYNSTYTSDMNTLEEALEIEKEETLLFSKILTRN